MAWFCWLLVLVPPLHELRSIGDLHYVIQSLDPLQFAILHSKTMLNIDLFLSCWSSGHPSIYFPLNIFVSHLTLDRCFIPPTMTSHSTLAPTNPLPSWSNVRQTSPTLQNCMYYFHINSSRVLTTQNFSIYIGRPSLPSTSIFHLGSSTVDFFISSYFYEALLFHGVFGNWDTIKMVHPLFPVIFSCIQSNSSFMNSLILCCQKKK